MLTDEMRAAGWIEHDGGPCPVPLDSRPWIMFRDGEVIADGGDDADYWVWEWGLFGQKFAALHIIAYRPEPRHD